MKFKKTLAILLAVIMLLSSAPLSGFVGLELPKLTASASTEGTYGNLSYIDYGSYIYITGCSTSVTSVEIPEEINGKPVTGIKECAFYECVLLESITIPDSITIIDKEAFKACRSINEVYISSIESWLNIVFIFNNSCPLFYGANLYLDNNILKNLVIPDGVTEIKDNAFVGCKSLKTVTIPDSVTSIGDSAFDNCRSIKEVHISSIEAWLNIDFDDVYGSPLCFGANLYINNTLLENYEIPDGTSEIKNYSFALINSLKTVTIPDSVTSIGEGAFLGCSSLESITIPDSVTSIGDYAFSECSSLKSVTIPDSITIIGNNMFRSCYSLESISIPDSVTSIGSGAFNECESLQSITIPDSVTSIDYLAFSGCSSLREVIIPKNVTVLSEYLFSGCSSMESITLPNGLKEIKNRSLKCHTLRSIRIPATVVSIDAGAFNASALQAIFFDGSEEQWNKIVDYTNNEKLKNVNIFFNFTDDTVVPLIEGECGDKGDNVKWKIDNKNVLTIYGQGEMFDYYAVRGSSPCHPWSFEKYIESIVVEEGVTTISPGAFFNIPAKKVTLPESLESIGHGAFDGCKSIKEINIPSKINNFYSLLMFDEMAALEKITLSKDNKYFYLDDNGILYTAGKTKLLSIPVSATSVTIPKECDYVSSLVFSFCKDLTNIEVEDGNETFYSENGILFESKNGINKYAIESCPVNINLTEYTVPSETVIIGNHAFENNRNIKKLIIPESVDDIRAAFKYSNMEEIDMPKEVRNLSSESFLYCTKLKSIILPEGTDDLQRMFTDCTSLESVHLPNTIKNIGQNAFYNCKSLKNVNIPNGVESIGDLVFSYCSSLESITIPNSVTSIGIFAFALCSSLKEIIISDSVKTIGAYAFSDCSSLEKIVLPKDLTEIPTAMLAECGSLKNIEIPEGVKTIGAHAFYNDSSLETIVIPSKVEVIDPLAFEYHTSLKKYIVDENNSNFSTDENGVLYNKDKTELIEYPLGSELEKYIMPNTVQSNSFWAISSANNLKTIAVSNSMTEISNYMFLESKSLNEVFIPKSVKKIDVLAFYGCENLETIYFEAESLSDIEIYDYSDDLSDGTFEGCKYVFGVPYHEHDAVTVPGKAATCTEKGLSEGTKCSVCSKVITAQQKIDIIPHDYSVYVNTVPSTCNALGYKVMKCKNCDAKTNVALTEYAGHTWNSGELTTPASCVETGTILVTCTICNTTKTESIPVNSKNHKNIVDDAAVESTCTATGLTAGKHCTACNTTVVAQTETAKKAHKYTVFTDTIPSTCVVLGHKVMKCANCTATTNVALTEYGTHTWNAGEVTTSATCCATGIKTFTCTACNDTRTETIAINANNHTGGTVIRNAVEESCGNNGYSGDTYCLGCDTKLATGAMINATGAHSWNAGEIITYATCHTKGAKTFTCTVCNKTRTDDMAINPDNHNGGTAVVNKKDAVHKTQTNGYTGDTKCLGCNAIISAGNDIAPTAHTPADTYTPNSTHHWKICTVDGCGEEIADSKAAHTPGDPATETTSQTCNDCGYVITPALGHTCTPVVMPARAATCTEKGLSEGTKCSECGTIIKEQTEIAALGHKEEVINGKPATCTENGLTDGKKCSVCGEVTVDQVETSTIGHDYTEVITKPTCTEDGFTTRTCKNCGEVIKADKTPAKGHTPSDWIVETAAKVGIKGLEIKKCTSCGEKLVEREIPALKEEPSTDAPTTDAPTTEAPTTEAPTTEEPTTETSFMLGDINGDGKVTATDARIILRISAKLEKLEDQKVTIFAAADVNGDGKITSVDARKILRVSARLESF